MTLDLHKWVTEEVVGAPENRIRAQARTHFGQFVKGEEIDDLDFMKRVEDRRRRPPFFGHGVWSVSPRFAPPQYRYFGLFVTQDWFFMCGKNSRDYLNDHDDRWHAEIDKALGDWNAFFSGELPHDSNELSDIISINAEHCDGRW
jgi:hypothetical protein